MEKIEKRRDAFLVSYAQCLSDADKLVSMRDIAKTIFEGAEMKCDPWEWAITFAPGMQTAHEATAAVESKLKKEVLHTKSLTFKVVRKESALDDITSLCIAVKKALSAMSLKVDPVMRMKHQLERPALVAKTPAKQKKNLGFAVYHSVR